MSAQLCVALSNSERSNRTHRCEIQSSRLHSILSAMRVLTVTGEGGAASRSHNQVACRPREGLHTDYLIAAGL